MTATVVLKRAGEIKRVADESAEYFELTSQGWDIDDIIGETESDRREREANEARQAGLDRLNAACDQIEAAAIKLGYSVKVSWANESSSRYITCDGYKVRVSDHDALYACDISVDPNGMSADEAIQWLADHKDEAEAE